LLVHNRTFSVVDLFLMFFDLDWICTPEKKLRTVPRKISGHSLSRLVARPIAWDAMCGHSSLPDKLDFWDSFVTT